MEDPELAAIRAARMGQGSQGGSAPAGEDQAKREAEEQMRRDLLATILDAAARERLARIALVSPDRAQQIEAILLRMVQSGQLRGRVSEAQLIELLDQMVRSRKPRRRKEQLYSTIGREDSTTTTTSDLREVRRLCTTTHATLLAVVALFTVTLCSHCASPCPGLHAAYQLMLPMPSPVHARAATCIMHRSRHEKARLRRWNATARE